jgi:hypothetical protein
MALLLILVALLGFAFASFGSSGSSSHGSGTVILPATTVTTPQGKCKKQMHAEPGSSHCRPPANP